MKVLGTDSIILGTRKLWPIFPMKQKLNMTRAPGSLSDRWSSLATIYPLRFHEIFGRWLSYNIKRVFQQKRKKRCILTGFLYRFLCKSKGKENSYRKEHNSLHIFHVICLTYIMPTKLLNIGIINWPDKYIGSSTAKLK